MLSGNVDDVNGEEYTQSFKRVRAVDSYKGKGIFKFNEEGKHKVEV